MEKLYYTAKEVAEMLDVSVSHAYKVIREANRELSSKGFYEAMKKGLDVYFNDPEQYQKMVNDSLGEDFSWIQKGKQGPVYDYLEKLGISRNTTPDVA